MLKPSFTKRFEKDIVKAKKRGKNIEKLKTLIVKLINEEPLEKYYEDHKLHGKYKNRRESHIEPDWLLIYKLKDNEIIFERTGTHSDLFR